MLFFSIRKRILGLLLGITWIVCVIFLTLYLLSEKENRLLRTAQSEKFTVLAAGEAEAAVLAYENGDPSAEVYHRLRAAASYLSMADPTEENGERVAALREAGDILLYDGPLPPDTQEILRRIGSSVPLSGTSSEETEEETEVDGGKNPPWRNLLPIRREEGIPIAETAAKAPHILQAAAGPGYVYTCDNVYVRLSPRGGIPLEMAVYTPIRKEEPVYAGEDCLIKCIEFLESVLPGSLFVRTKSPESAEIQDFICRITYPCGDWRIQVDVRTDTGRVTAMQMLEPL